MNPDNLTHILLDNNEYESTGSQKTVSNIIDFPQIASASGYSHVVENVSLSDLGNHFSSQENKLSFIYIPIEPGFESNLPRPTVTPPQVASRFRTHIQELD